MVKNNNIEEVKLANREPSVNSDLYRKYNRILIKIRHSVFFFHLSLCRTSGSTAVMAVQAQGLVQVPDQDPAHAQAAEAETTSSKALPRYRYIRVCVCVCVCVCVWHVSHSFPSMSTSERNERDHLGRTDTLLFTYSSHLLAEVHKLVTTNQTFTTIKC